MASSPESKTHTCTHCKKASETIGIKQMESRYYSCNMQTGQWEDFHGDESVQGRELFCINCNAKINERINV